MDKLALIAHRGNIYGVNRDLENKESYLQEALSQGYWIECDVQMFKNKLYFGHDEPRELATELITNPRTICHAKDAQSLIKLNQLNVHFFWHETDKITITNRGYFWCYPGIHLKSTNAIWLDLLHKPIPDDISGIFGICSDDFSKSSLI